MVSLERPAGAPSVPFVGRDDELRRVMAVYDAAVVARSARLAVVLGSPGLSKSRLIAEIASRLAPQATVLLARCDPAGGATFAPLAPPLRTLLHIGDGADADAVRRTIDAVMPGQPADRARIASGISALLAGIPAAPEETFFVVRRLLAAIAASRPVVSRSTICSGRSRSCWTSPSTSCSGARMRRCSCWWAHAPSCATCAPRWR